MGDRAGDGRRRLRDRACQRPLRAAARGGTGGGGAAGVRVAAGGGRATAGAGAAQPRPVRRSHACLLPRGRPEPGLGVRRARDRGRHAVHDRALAAAAAGAVDLPLPVVRRDRGDRGVGGGRDRPGRDRVDAPVRGAGHLRAGLPGGQQPGGGGAAACGDRGVGGGACGGRHRAVGDQLDPVDRRPPPRQRHVPAARSLRHLPGGGDGGGAGAGVRCPRPVAVAGAGRGWR